MRVLVVEDDKAVQFTFEETFLSEGYEVFLAADGQEALDLLDKILLPDVIITDLTMYPMDGRELIVRLKQNQNLSTIPIVVVSGEENTDDIVDCCIFKKPFKMEELLAKISKHCFSSKGLNLP